MRVAHADAAFYDFGADERLLVAAQEIDHRSYVIALLGGDAGLRAGRSSRSNGKTSISNDCKSGCGTRTGVAS
jgi:hypothetical protein